MYHYQKQNNLFQLIDDNFGNVIYEGLEVAICYDKAANVLLRHGSLEIVERYYEDTINKYIEHNLFDIAIDIVYVKSNKWEIDELNKMLDICDYVGKMVKKSGIQT